MLGCLCADEGCPFSFLVSGLAGHLAMALLGQEMLNEGTQVLEAILQASPSTLAMAEPFLFRLFGYCARISSPLRVVLSGRSTRSSSKPRAVELTIAAICASRGSRGLLGVYTKVGLAAPPKTLGRDDGRDGADGVDDNDDDMWRRLDYGTSELA